jgi:transcriptional regulator with XRE-family HTH domain
MTTFAEALKAAIKKAGRTNNDVSTALGYTGTFISNVTRRNAIAKGGYTKLLRMFPELREAPLPKNIKKPPTKASSAGSLRAQREKLDWSVAELARRAGVSSKWVGLIEKGEATPSEAVRGKLERALKANAATSVLQEGSVPFVQFLAAINHFREDADARQALRTVHQGSTQFGVTIEELLATALKDK